MNNEELTCIAAGFGVDGTGRMDIWRERISQDHPVLESVRGWAPVSTRPPDYVRRPLSNGDREGALEQTGASHTWDRAEGESIAERVEETLARIEAHADLNAFTRVFFREALADARLLDARLARGKTIGPLGGAIVTVKDIMGVRGSRISAGTAALRSDNGKDSLVVSRLRAAGGIIIGTANLHALAYGPFSTSSDFGPVRNPLNKAVVAGGSSGGSAAAVAAGLADIAVGTDTAGSIRMPAALCGVVGVKPTYSTVPSKGTQPLAPSLDHIGPLTRTIADAQAALNAMRGFDGKEIKVADGIHFSERPLTGVTIGLADSYVEGLLAPPIRAAFEQAKGLVRELGARLRRIHLPTLAAAPGIMLCTLGPEALHTFKDLLRERASMLPDDVRLRLEAGMFITAADYAHCQLLRQDLHHEVETAFDQVDVIMTPTMPITAPLLNEIDGNSDDEGPNRLRGSMNALTLPFNLTGNPALSLPFLLDERGAGIGMQLVGARYADSHLLMLASIIEANMGALRSAPSYGS
ncbi:amidase [Pseudarthrobacter sp. H2]|uniref:amidase n=1 Tax=Pseudarthrobacter sp. H2 TaxID=3418415 RepID=UPI003CECC6A9